MANEMAHVELPQLLIGACDGDARIWQRFVGAWVMEPKSEEARLRRAGRAERLLQTMKAERELPPLLAIGCAERRMRWMVGSGCR